MVVAHRKWVRLAPWAGLVALVSTVRILRFRTDQYRRHLTFAAVVRPWTADTDGSGGATQSFPYPVDLLDGAHDPLDLPVPLQVLQEYMRVHSAKALRRDPHPERRRFSLAFYSCPHEAGNWYHRFWNDLLWAVLTNRTVLWKYWDHDTCRAAGWACYSTNTERDCAEVLVRSPWMASYDEWKERLFAEPLRATSENATRTELSPLRLPYHVTMANTSVRPGWPVPENFEQDLGVDLPGKYPHRLVIFPACEINFRQLRMVEFQEAVLKTEAGRETARRLFSLGAAFLYGMLHRYTFDFAPLVREAVPQFLFDEAADYYTIGLHSRHRYEGSDGCDVDRELDCLDSILDRRDDARPVRVSIMADRICTVRNLTEILQANNVSVVSVPHDAVSPGRYAEHGPFAGIGFFHDLAVVSTSRSAVVGLARSSSDVLRELITFNDIMEQWRHGRGVERMIMDCILSPLRDPDAPVASPLEL